ncbi:MAG: hypothetical protein HYY06_24920 [Deltaproteobacteria bacterium]|nr:hypothetical protein [Deltaproteobacteria bacterium]
MRYQCVSCDLSFDVDGEKPRCPRCRKTTGLELVPEGRAPRKNVRGVVALAAILAAVAGGYLWWAERAPAGVPSDVPMRPLESDELGAFARDRGVTSKRPPAPFEESEQIARFARRASKGASGRAALAAEWDALRELGGQGGFRPHVANEPRDTDVRSAKRAFAAIQRKHGERLYSLELALVLASAARAVGAQAMVVEVLAYPGERTPVDPSGYLGHFAVALAPAGKAKRPIEVFDLHRDARTRLPASGAVVLDDVAVLGHFLNHQALFELGQASDAASAMEKVELGLELAPRAVPLLGTRGAILASSGAVREGIRDLERALHVRRDAARHHNLGAMLLSTDPDRAAREVGEALSAAPDFAAAHATMAALHIARSNLTDALAELETAERLDRELSMLPFFWANYHMKRGDADAAVLAAKEAVRRRPNDDRAHLMLASLYHELGRVLDMHAELRAVLARTSNREQMRDLIRANFGAAALEAAEEPEEEPAAHTSSPDAGSRVAEDQDGGGRGLELGSKVLGTGGEGGGPRLRLGDGSGLRLGPGAPGGGLKLRLGEP